MVNQAHPQQVQEATTCQYQNSKYGEERERWDFSRLVSHIKCENGGWASTRSRSLTCMNAVAIITPDPKYFAMKNASGGTRMRFVRAAIIGSKAPESMDQLMQLGPT